MAQLKTLFENNKKWSLRMRKRDPRYFSKLVHVHKPQYLWIGCSDSRVPANEITGLLPGEVFVHRNIANIVYLNDLNCITVVQYAVNVLKVKHIIICGHYNCGGVRAVMEMQKLGKIDAWLTDIKTIVRQNSGALKKIKTKMGKINRVCELNVLYQAKKITQLGSVARAIKGRRLHVHAWIYDLHDGLVKELFNA